MNNQELRAAERKEICDLHDLAEFNDYATYIDAVREVERKYAVLRLENVIVQDWGFPAEEWATLSQETKAIIANMVEEANRYEQLREDLQGWLEEAP